MRSDYRTESFSKVSVCGVECEFNDMRIERSSVPVGKYQYEVAGDDDRVYWSISLVHWSVTGHCLSGMMVYCGWRMMILCGCKIC